MPTPPPLREYFDPEIECAPPSTLAANSLERIAQEGKANNGLFRRAARSPLYGPRWQQAGLAPEDIQSYADFRRLPYVGASELRVAQQNHHPDAFICSNERPRYWISTSGSTGVPKWVPVGSAERGPIREAAFRLLSFSARRYTDQDVGMSITAPAPFISDTSLWSGALLLMRGFQISNHPDVESVVFTFEQGLEGVAMSLRRKTSFTFAFPSLMMRIGRGITDNAALIAKNQLKDQFSLENLLAYLVTRVRKVLPRDLTRVHTGFFAGEPVGPYRQPLKETWGLENAFSIYTFSEFQTLFAECAQADGMHVWLDICFPEFIPMVEIERENEQPGYEPQAIPLWEAAPGAQGELVITDYKETFPLVRWRTGDLVEMVSAEPCGCGRTHPRVHILQRHDDLVNLGVVRFSVFTLQEKLQALRSPAPVARWQLRVGRDGYMPRLTVLVCPDARKGEVDEAEFAQAVRAGVDSIEALRLGWQNGLVNEPIVTLDWNLGERISSSGKFRPLVYESDLGAEPSPTSKPAPQATAAVPVPIPHAAARQSQPLPAPVFLRSAEKSALQPLPGFAPLFAPLEPEAILRQPLDELVTQTNTRLAASGDLLQRAARSSLYQKNWRAAGLRSYTLSNRSDLRPFPFTERADLVRINESSRSLANALLGKPRNWIATQGTQGEKIWLPLTLQSIGSWFGRIRRLHSLLGPRPGAAPLSVLAINQGMPKVSNALPYLWEQVDDLLGEKQIEWLIVSMAMLQRNHWDQFVVQKQPAWMLSSVADARSLAAHLAQSAPPAEKLPSLKRGMFWGAPLDKATRQELTSLYGLDETFSVYLSTECREVYAECPAHNGLHLWMDGPIHEIIPDGQPGEALFLDEAPPGTTGEYVYTSLDPVLPLVRYRTGDRVRLVSSQPCTCGITHPRVEFIGGL